jgi:L-threonylcarbamoyladenylate synthase
VPAAAAALRAGEVIVVPTDTLYGLAALPQHAGAMDTVYLAKDRPPTLHLPVLAASEAQVRALGVDVTPTAVGLAARWWPGPLTMVFGFSAGSSRADWLAERDEVAIRIPDLPFLHALMEVTGVLAVTSANRHGEPTPATGAAAAEAVNPYASLLIDGGELAGAPSTLVNVRGATATVEREGVIPVADIMEFLDRGGASS